MKIGKPAEKYKQSRMYPATFEVDELLALARMAMYINEQIAPLSESSARAAFNLQKSIAADIKRIRRRNSLSKTKLN